MNFMSISTSAKRNEISDSAQTRIHFSNDFHIKRSPNLNPKLTHCDRFDKPWKINLVMFDFKQAVCTLQWKIEAVLFSLKQ